MKDRYVEMKCEACGIEYACYMKIRKAFVPPSTCPCVDSNIAEWKEVNDSPTTIKEAPEGYFNEE